VIASSTGGPEALRKIFSNLKGYRGPPILIVQHMPPIFTKQLAQLLAEHSGWTVKEAEEGELMQSNTAYLAPGDFHMVLRQRLGKYYLALSSADKVKSVRPSADVLFKSIAEFYRSQVWAFVLTGMGEDGLDGVRELKKHRARIFIQDQNSSIVWGMPGAIAKENLQNRVLDLNEIASLILKQEEL
jgi:two-component system chemotaxis response regulator CheB